MTAFAYELQPHPGPRLGLIVLQADETIEDDLRRLVPPGVGLMATRVVSDTAVTSDTLARMAGHLTAAAAMFPAGLDLDVVGYGCTSGTAEIGAPRIAELVRAGAPARQVTEPVSALVAACGALGVSRLAILSPYVPEVSARLRDTLTHAGIATPAFGSFEEAEEARVARIAPQSVIAAGQAVAEGADVQALFLSCTNLRTLDALPELAHRLGMPVLSSNLVLAWHMLRLSGHPAGQGLPGDLVSGYATAQPG